MNAKHILFFSLLGLLSNSALALTLSQGPLFISYKEPRIMLLMSRDHELSKKAYTDYTDLNDDQLLDTTYKDNVNYYGYFNANRCYTYNSNRFEPAGTAGGLASPNNHQCSGQWSGNFLNWATMTRLDVVRKVLYGGFRSTDTTGTALGTTVLERAFLPPDVHAFAKVYAPNGTTGNGTEVSKYTPYSPDTGITLCNVSDMGAGVQAGSINTVNGTSTSPAPLIKVASGAWTQWAMTEILQCQWKEDFAAETSATRPTKASNQLTGSSDLNARVAVCVPNQFTPEDKCKSYYTRAATPVKTVKPTGLLQQYGDVEVERRTRFGLMTGSYLKNTAGGVLRKNINLLTNNSNSALDSSDICVNILADDEINVCTGQFINQATTDRGIVNTLNRIHLAGYKTPASGAITSTHVCSSGYNNSAPYACNSSSLLSGTNGTCVDWGNPLSEMYHEALRYFAGKTSAKTDYAVDDSTVIAGLGQATWNSSSDPLPATEWCALSNIIVLSTGLTSLDNATISTDISGLDPTSLTNSVGTDEGISGSYLIGSNGTTSDNQCSPKTLSNLSSASGICPELPHMKGGYLIAGLANSNRSLDLRPGYAANRVNRWTGINADWVARQPLGTYTVGLAENLPSFEITVGSGKVSLVPACRSNGSTICSMTDLRVESYSTTAASFLVSWEDNSAGSDYDMDTIARIQYCVGAACSPAVSSNQIQITVSAAQSATGSGMELGYTVSGVGASDGTVFPIKIPGTATCNPTDCGSSSANQKFFSLLVSPAAFRCTDFTTATPSSTYTCPGTTIRMPKDIVSATGCPSGSNCGCPKTTIYTQSGSLTAGLLKNPLWYAAKYAASATKWDLKDNIAIPDLFVPDGIPDNFFDVRNPATLYNSLATVFDLASQSDASSASVATNSTNLKIESRIFQAKFSGLDWSGQLLSYNLNAAGVLGTTAEWDAGEEINSQAPSARVILTKGATGGVGFSYTNLTGPTDTIGTQQNLLDKDATGVVDNCGPERVDYLRGDDTNEGTDDALTCASGSIISQFRQRNISKLGDIVNSNPWYVGSPSAGFSDVDYPGYSQFRRSKLTRKPVVYAGSNDGMLHGFDASLDFSSNDAGVPIADVSGKEILAYIPSEVFPNLSKLAAQTYNKDHRYFVDGSPMVGDADLDSSATNDWRTILVGAMGAGGKGYYALDISNPANFSESNAADTVLWEFNESDMGYVYNMPPVNSTMYQAKQIVKMANGKWAAILGNGYNSTSGKAVLYILFIEDGLDGTWSASDYVKIVADAPAGSNNGFNGLSTPVPFDTNEDGYADTVYAGDLKGHLWKFLVGPNSSDTTVTDATSTWKVAFSSTTCANTTAITASTCTSLFTALDSVSNAQPIIWPPEVVAHPNGGQMVLFGTGKYIEPSDNTIALGSPTQTFYGIWDRHDGTTLGARASDLLQQTVTSVLTTTAGKFRVTSTNAIQWRSPDCAASSSCAGTYMGWYIDLPTTGERVTGIPKKVNNVIFFNTLIPSDTLCNLGTGWLMSLDYLSGSMADSHRIFDTNNNGEINDDDAQVGGYQIGAALGGTTLIQGTSTSDSSNTGVGVSSLTSGALNTTLINFGNVMRGRLNWREIVQ